MGNCEDLGGFANYVDNFNELLVSSLVWEDAIVRLKEKSAQDKESNRIHEDKRASHSISGEVGR